MADEVVKPRITSYLIAIGRDPAKMTDISKAWAYAPLGDLEINDGRSYEIAVGDKFRYYKTRPKFMIGTVISVESPADDPTSIFPDSMKLVEHWKNRDDVATWNAMSRAVEMAEESQSKAIKAIKSQLPEEAFAPFRRAYHELHTSRQRSQILAWIIEEVTRFRGDAH